MDTPTLRKMMQLLVSRLSKSVKEAIGGALVKPKIVGGVTLIETTVHAAPEEVGHAS